MKHLVTKILLALVAAMPMLATSAHAEMKIGIMSPRGAIATMQRWGEMGKYLEKELGTTVKIVPLKPNETVEAVKNGSVEYVLTNPVLAVILAKKLDGKPFATMNTNSGSQFAGVIIGSKKSGVTKAADLKGKKVMGFKFKRSAAAYVFQVKHMMDQGIDPHKDFAEFKESKKQDDIVLAVKVGVFDGGFVKSGLLETMAKEGKIKMDDVVVLDKKDDSLSHVHSTILYPEWTFTASAKSDDAATDKIKAALLKLKQDDPASKSARIAGFVDLVSLADLDSTLQALKLPPYE